MTIDPVCAFHGKRRSEHVCLYCCLCFRTITPDECNVLPDGSKEDVCLECAELERAELRRLIEAQDERLGGRPVLLGDDAGWVERAIPGVGVIVRFLDGTSQFFQAKVVDPSHCRLGPDLRWL
jgi:hypothetical protein